MEFQDELKQEISDLLRNPPDSWLIFPPNLKKSTYLHALVLGPSGSPYENEPLLMKIDLPSRYSFGMPECEFVTPIQCPFVRFRQRRPRRGLAVNESEQMAYLMYFPTIPTHIRSSHTIREVLSLISQQLAVIGKEEKVGRLRRIKIELTKIQENPPVNCSLRQLNEENYYNLIATVIGPKGSWYENGIFTVEIDLSCSYPFNSPLCHFTTPIYHPNVNEKGDLCVLHPLVQWTIAHSLRDIMTALVNLLAQPDLECVHQGDEALSLLRNDKQRYIAKAIKWTHKFASKG
jgi:ubiquitin-conjugating enzyme E2 D/E